MRLITALILSPMIAAPVASATEAGLEASGSMGEWRTATKDDADTTSRCYTNQIDPICLVDAYLLCKLRLDKAICDSIGKAPGQNVDFFLTWKYYHKKYETHLNRYRYRMIFFRGPYQEVPFISMPWEEWRFGETGNHVIGIEYIDCFTPPSKSEESCAAEPGLQLFLALQRVGHRWLYVDSYEPKVD